MARTRPLDNPLAAAVRNRRKALGLNQAQVGDLAGCGRIFVHDLERGKATVRLDKVLAVLSVLGLRLVVEDGRGGMVARHAGPRPD